MVELFTQTSLMSVSALQLAMRVPNNEARRALVQLRLAFEEAERLMPGVSVSLVADIVEGVEPFETDADES